VKPGMELAFSVTVKDCEVQTFRSGGKGGQNQNKRDTGVRIIHRPSGAVGESRQHRTQLENKRAAFRRMAEHGKFRFWVNAKLLNYDQVVRDVEEMMKRDEDFLVEYKVNGRWEKAPD
jgi:protein subunit release factor B